MDGKTEGQTGRSGKPLEHRHLDQYFADHQQVYPFEIASYLSL